MTNLTYMYRKVSIDLDLCFYGIVIIIIFLNKPSKQQGGTRIIAIHGSCVLPENARGNLVFTIATSCEEQLRNYTNFDDNSG